MLNVMFKHSGAPIDEAKADQVFVCMSKAISESVSHMRCRDSKHSSQATLVIDYDTNLKTSFSDFCCMDFTQQLCPKLGFLCPR